MKLKVTATCLLLVGMGAAGVILAAPQTGPSRTRVPHRGPRAESRTTPRSAPTARGAAKKVQPALQAMESYVVDPPDLIVVEVLEALPGRPISGERLIRPDGKISLGFYGEIYVAGLTIMEVKEKIVQHLRKHINDDILGLIELDENGNHMVDEKTGKPILKDLKDTDRVFVDVTTYNSKNYYIQGEVQVPGSLPITGHETVLDAINYVGGLTPRADHGNVILYRKAKDGGLQRLPIDIDQITMGDDPTTNYQLQPGDRLVIPAKSGAAPAGEPGAAKPSPQPSSSSTRERDHRPTVPVPAVRDRIHDLGDAARAAAADGGPALRDLERRLGEVERKLDRVLEALERKTE